MGFGVESETCVLGEVRVRLAGTDAGKGICGWALRDVAATELDGLPTERSGRQPPAAAPAHPNGVAAIDHVVAITPDLGGSVAALDAAGIELAPIREEPTPAGVVIGTNEPTARLQMAQDFIAAIGKHRHWTRGFQEQAPA